MLGRGMCEGHLGGTVKNVLQSCVMVKVKGQTGETEGG